MAGFQRFDPERWEAEPEQSTVAKVAKTAKVEGENLPAEPAFATLATLASLPGVMAAGLSALNETQPPVGVPADAWAEVVSDAQRLVSEGWASTALSLGWSALDLFGAVTDKQGDPAADGLAVKLSGRKVLAICASFATVADANGGRTYLYRGNTEGARLLWALSRGAR